MSTAFACEVCGKGMAEGVDLIRMNKPGEMPARWRCWKDAPAPKRSELEGDVAMIRGER